MSRCNSLVLIIICLSLLIPMVSGLGVDIGPDQSVRFGDTVPFRVSVSDYMGGTLVYTWTFGDGTTMSGSSITPDFLRIHRYTHEGTYAARLSVKGEDGTGAVDTAIITVATVEGRVVGWGLDNYGQAMPPPGNNYVGIGVGSHHSFALTLNHPPTANAGPDQTINVYSPISLDGSSSSDPDGDPLTYKWSILTRPAGSTTILSDTTAQKPAFTADKIGDYTIQLIVNDGRFNSAPSKVTLHATQIAVPVDIEPGICPNIIALNMKGPYLFVVIPGTNNLDAKKIDPATVTLSREGSNGVVKPRVNTIFDIATPYAGTTTCGCHNRLFDYTQDLVLAFDLGEVMTKLQLQDVVGETVPFTVQGALKEEYGTTPITGSDCMNVLSEYYKLLYFFAACPVDLKITDPDGLEISKLSHEIPSAFYIEADFNDDGSPDDFIFIGERKIGDYSVQVIPDSNALPTDTYSLKVGSSQSEVILANNVAINNVPDKPYKIQVAQNGEITVPAKVRIVPNTLNTASKGKFVVFITLPSNYKAADVDSKSVVCEGAPALRLIRIKAFTQTFAAVFSREKLVNVKPGDKVQLTVTGIINKNGQKVGFRGIDIINVISKKVSIKDAIDDVDKMTDEKVFGQFNPK